jgi:hypothetical protein
LSQEANKQTALGMSIILLSPRDDIFL